MSRRNQKKKIWLDRRSRLGHKEKRRKKSQKKYRVYSPYIVREHSGTRRPQVTVTPPKVFSLADNPEETMSFFMGFAKEIEFREHGTVFFIDSKDVESASADALIFLIAILQNESFNKHLNYSFAGNYPRSAEANRIYAESGFNDYVVSKMRRLPDSTDKMRIICGTNNSPTAAKELSNFIMTNLGKSRAEIQPIQKVLIELMSNVYHHAYDKNTFMAKKWYMYAEFVDDSIRCVFVDTGFGIAKTARKNFKERIKLSFGLQVDDAKIMKSIFNGDFRTATNEHHRGNGLRSVRNNVSSPIFERFEVISGRGRCIIPKAENTETILTECYENKLFGTLFQFTVK